MSEEPLPPGRPTVMTQETLAKLTEAFSMGCNVTEACLFADIGKDSYYRYDKANPGFSDRMQELRSRPNLTARMNMVKHVNTGDVEASKWWLERRNKDEFSPRTTLAGDPEAPVGVQIIHDIPRK